MNISQTTSADSGFTLAELMVVAASREIKDHEVVFVGMRLPLLAFLVAKQHHAPNAVALYENGVIRETPAPELLFTMGDPPNILNATMATDMITVMSLLQNGRVDIGFLGAGEVDKYGNLNSTLARKPNGSPVRLPGSGGAADIASLAKRTVALLEHSKQRLPERVAYLTSPGYGDGPGWRERAGLRRGGPSCLITTRAVMRFDSHTREAVVESAHPGVSAADLRDNTGWALTPPEPLPVTAAPTTEELQLIRRIDPERFWTA
ncbi:MAG TPA: CoA-transferase [candidate division Zixibacteria bacterium]|nr:CoA-transferase [candidate division Zixibacteria bacterium]